MIRRIGVVLLALMFVASFAWADNRPEFDAVGQDATNYFNDFIKEFIVDNATNGFGVLINEKSDFRNLASREFFSVGQNAIGPSPDTCFNALKPYTSYLTKAAKQGVYQWSIVLQMTPESDLNINIRDCVVKDQSHDILTGAQQTGRFTDLTGRTNFVLAANPRITVVAVAGPNATPGWTQQTLVARQMPGLTPLALNRVFFTSKALWEDGVVAAMPEFGADGQFELSAGDRIVVTIEVPPVNTTDIRYAADNVVIKYIGEVDTEVLGN